MRNRRAVWYAVAGAALSLGEPIGLLIVRALTGAGPIAAELFRERVTYLYVFVTTAGLLAWLGYRLGQQADRLQALSETDALTGLANRRALRRKLADEVQRASRYETPVSLLLIDVDGLKRINDEAGHAAGDRQIRRVAESIAMTVRASDMGARWGGDEFAIVMPNADPDAALHLAERLVAHLAASRSDSPESVTVSVGIATFDPERTRGVTAEQLTRSADTALYSAKASGRNRIRAA